MENKKVELKRLYCKVCGEVFYISPESTRPWSYCPDCGNQVFNK